MIDAKLDKAKRAGNSGAEEKFIQMFCDVFGPEKLSDADEQTEGSRP